MKKLSFVFILSIIFSSNIFAYVNMSDQLSRANDLNMTLNDYTFAMAFSGVLSGSIFGIFLWKSR